MEFQFIKTTACLTSLGLCGTFLGCQSVDKQDYYQPHTHRTDMVQQVPRMPHSQPAPAIQQPMGAPQQQSAPLGPMYTPKQRPTLIAPPGHNAPPPMAPPAVPGVAPYGTPDGGIKPVPAPTSWLPSQPGTYLPTSYEPVTQVMMPWVMEPANPGTSGLICPGQTLETAQTGSGQMQFVPIRFDAPHVTQNGGHTLFAPDWQDRQSSWEGQVPQFVTPWQVQQQETNPVALNSHQLNQQLLAFPPRQPQLAPHPEPIMISPPASELMEEWPAKVALAEPEVIEEFEPDPDSVEAFVKGDLPVIQPEIRHRLRNGQSGIKQAVSEEPSPGTLSVPEMSGPLPVPEMSGPLPVPETHGPLMIP